MTIFQPHVICCHLLFGEAKCAQSTIIHLDVTHLDVCQILVNIGAFWDAVALVEVEGRSEHVLTEPHLSKGVEEPFVIVISHAASILNLSDHVSYCVP